MRRLFHRIYVSLFGVTLLAVGLTAVVVHHLLAVRTHGPYGDRLAAEAELVAARLPSPETSPADVKPILEHAARELRLDLALVSAEGQTLISTNPDLAPFHGWPPQRRWVLARRKPLCPCAR